MAHEFGHPKRYYGHGIELYGAGRSVTDIGFSSRYYRTTAGFGVGSKIPTGGSWHGFIWNGIVKIKPCSCWVKVGTGKRSLPATGASFGRPWKIVYVRNGRVASFYFSSHYVD